MKDKVCKLCQKVTKIFSKGACKSCDQKLNPQKYTLKRSSSSLKKAGTKIKKTSKSQKSRLETYKTLRDDYLKQHKICEVCGLKAATEIHHKRGRIGENLFRDFLAVDSECHRWIEENPKLAKEGGYSLSRLN